MDYNKLIEYRARIRDNMDILLEDNEFELSIKYLVTIHEKIFKSMLYNCGHFRHFNIEREEEILNLESIDYPDYHTIPTYLRFIFRDQAKIDYKNMNIDEVIYNISKFISELWLVHNVFKENARYFRDALVRANYEDEDNGISSSYDALINFYNKVLVDSDINLNEEYLYIPEVFNKNNKVKKRVK